MEVVFRALSLIVLVFILGQLWKTTFAVRGAKLTACKLAFHVLVGANLASL